LIYKTTQIHSQTASFVYRITHIKRLFPTIYRSQWSSEGTIAWGARDSRIESRCGQKVSALFTIRSFGHGLHTDCIA